MQKFLVVSLVISCHFISFAADTSNRSKTELVAAFHFQNPTHVAYSDQLISSGGVIHEIPAADFAAQHQFEWTEGVLVERSLRDKVWADRRFSKASNAAVEERLHKPLEALVVCDMGEVGKGVFLRRDAKPLPAGTIIGIYAGSLEKYSDTTNREYLMSASEIEHRQSLVSEIIKNPSLNALHHGNIIRFIQDLPNIENDLEGDKTVSTLALDNVVTENLGRMSCTHKGFPINYVITLREIQPGEQLGFPYEADYWQRKNFDRALFDIDGNIIGHLKKDGTITWRDSFKPSLEKKAPRVEFEKVMPIVRPILANTNLDQFDYRLRFVADVKACLKAFVARSTTDDEGKKTLSTLDTTFDQAVTTDDKFMVLHKQLKSGVGVPSSAIKQELIFHMQVYNQGKSNSMEKLKN